MAYDVGAIVRDTQAEFGLFTGRTRAAVDRGLARNRATPENLELLLGALVHVTNGLAEWRTLMDADQDWRVRVLDTGGIEALATIDSDLAAWQSRLDGYIFEVSKAPAGDRRDVLWSVTAPLLLGFFGGPTAKQGRAPADLGTPFSLANRLLVSEEWASHAFEAWQSDLVDGALDLASVIPRAVAGAGDLAERIGSAVKVLVPIVAVAVVINALTRRRRR